MRSTPLFIFLLFALLSACSLKEIKDAPPAVNKLKVNERYRINLPEDHRNGYTWNLNDSFNKSVIENINTVWHGNSKGVDFNFRATAVGQTTLTFILRKYTDTADYKQYFVEIEQ